MNKKTLKAKITKALRKGISANKSALADLIPESLTAGKAYEAYVLGLVCERLHLDEGFSLRLVGGTKIALKSSPGPINTSYPHIKVFKEHKHIANIWTDVEFTALSATKSGKHPLSLGDYHEMDIAVVLPTAEARPTPDQVLLLVECKNTGYQKTLLREILGIRRELSFLSHPSSSFFSKWPRSTVPADPPSCITVFSTDPAVLNYCGPGTTFGIDFFHEPL
jgi:hypothetical protein